MRVMLLGILLSLGIWNSIGACLAFDKSFSDDQSTLKLKRIRNYVCHYGSPDIDAQGVYDLNIIESNKYSIFQIKRLQNSSIVLGYLSIGEMDRHESHFLEGYDRWLVDADGDGSVDVNSTWNSRLANPDSPQWLAYVLNKAKAIIRFRGCDGLFLDTLGTARKIPGAMPGMIALIAKIRENFPDKIIVANRGFEMLEEITPYIDGVMFENFTTDYDWESKSYFMLQDASLQYHHRLYNRKIRNFMNSGRTVLALDYASPEDKILIDRAWSRAVDYGFIPAVSGIYLNQIDSYQGEMDKEFLEKYGLNASYMNERTPQEN